MHELAMFPLGAVLLPGATMPLHVFEPRYRQMVVDCLAGSELFGQVLITHGHEVGGGDERADVATLARIVEVEPFADGRYALVASGIERIRITRWLPDDPYPRADADTWPDDPDGASITDLDTAVSALADLDQLAMDLAGRSIVDLADLTARLDRTDLSRASFQVATATPVGPHDQHRLLAEPGPQARLRALVEVIEDVAAMLRFSRS